MNRQLDDVVRGVPVGTDVVHEVGGVAEVVLDEQVECAGAEVPGR